MDGFKERWDCCQLSPEIHSSFYPLGRGLGGMIAEQVCEWATTRYLTRALFTKTCGFGLGHGISPASGGKIKPISY